MKPRTALVLASLWVLGACAGPGVADAERVYVIEEVLGDDEVFVINGQEYEAWTNCLGWEEGDRVAFVDDRHLPSHTSDVLLNLRTRERCEVSYH
ncbi:MAG: hypothetical protein HYV16_13370 [Gammaproteobacteria bacterium]|nr:hypothetical protein [Gammaproteobacteria bacterium]